MANPARSGHLYPFPRLIHPARQKKSGQGVKPGRWVTGFGRLPMQTDNYGELKDLFNRPVDSIGVVFIGLDLRTGRFVILSRH